MINEGRLLSQHGFAKANSWITLVLSILLLVAGAIQLAFLLTVDHPASSIYSVFFTALLSIALGVVLMFLRRLIRPHQIYQLHENGILVISQEDKKKQVHSIRKDHGYISFQNRKIFAANFEYHVISRRK